MEMHVSRSSPPVSKLLFADDSLFYCKTETREFHEVMKEIKTYEKAYANA